VLAVCIGPARRRAVVDMLAELTAAGGSALLVTADGAVSPDLPDGVLGLDLVATERTVGVNRVLARPDRLWRAWMDSRAYRAVRPWMLWRALRRRLHDVRPEDLDHIVIVGLESWPITWQLCRGRPHLSYGWNVPADVHSRVADAPPVEV
jgi:hypothetical protein